jgi:polyisoprenoid-binding protein YceI
MHMFRRRFALSLLLPAGLLAAAGAARVGSQPAATGPADPTPPATSQAAAVRYVVAPTGNEGRYRLREKLVGMELPYDAVGTTGGVTGAIALDASGKVVPAESKLTIDVTALKSDKEKRDGYVQRRLLETEKYPTVEFVPTAIRGIPAKIPTSGSVNFEMDGKLTVKGVTHPTTWKGTANFQGDRVTGNAYTVFTFDDVQLQKPSVSVILTLADDIRLEYDFALQRQK